MYCIIIGLKELIHLSIYYLTLSLGFMGLGYAHVADVVELSSLKKVSVLSSFCSQSQIFSGFSKASSY